MAHISDKVFFVMKRAGKAAFDHAMLWDGARALVALSGGAGSMALLKAMHARMPRTPIQYQLVPLHVIDGSHGPEYVVVPALEADCATMGLHLQTIEAGPRPDTESFPHEGVILEAAKRMDCQTLLLGDDLTDAALAVWAGMVKRRTLSAKHWAETFESDGHSVLVGRPMLDLLPEPLLEMAEIESLSHFPRVIPRQDEELLPLLRQYAQSKGSSEVEKLRNLRQAPANVKDEYLV